MGNSLLNKKIPTLLGIILLLCGIFFTTIIINTKSLLQINATPTEDPKDVRITNVSDSSFSVSYTTDSSVIGTVNWGETAGDLSSLSLDDRDQLSQKISKYTVHEITVKSLSPDTKYFFEINSGDKQYLDNTSPYQIKTGVGISSSPISQNPMTGKIVTLSGDSPLEALVYIKINGAQDLSSLTKSDGSYAIPLNGLRDKTLSNYFPLDSDSIIAIEVFTNASNAQASTNANQISPVPAITLSNNYDFSSAQVSPSPAATQSVSFPVIENLNQSQVTTQPSPTVNPTIVPETPTPTPTPTVTLSPTPEEIAQVITPLPTNELSVAPTLPATGNSSAIMIPVFAIALFGIGIFLFLATGRKIPL